MKSIIEKIGDSIIIITPIIGIILVALNLNGVLPELEKWTEVALTALSAVAAVLKIWGVNETKKITTDFQFKNRKI